MKAVHSLLVQFLKLTVLNANFIRWEVGSIVKNIVQISYC